MAYVFLAFLLPLLLIVGLYWLLVELPDRREEARLQARLEEAAGPPLSRTTVTRIERPLSAIGLVEHLLRQTRGLVQPLQKLIERSGMKTTAGTILLASVFTSLLAGLLAGALTHSVLIRVLAVAAAFALPILYVRHVFSVRLATLEEQMPDAIELVSRSLRAGHALTTAIELSSQELPEPICSEFRLLFERQNYGMSLEDALYTFASHVPVVDARFFVTAVLTQREVGGNLSDVLDRLAAVIRDRFTVKRQIRVISAHGRITGWVLGLLSPAIALILFIVAPDYMRDLVRDPIGVQMVMGSLLLQGVGVLAIRRIVNVEY